MNDFIATLIEKVRSHQKQIVDFSLLTDKSWFLVSKDASYDKVIYIFRSENQLLISKNGDVTKAKWSIVNHATQSLFIEKKDGGILFNIQILTHEYLLLQKDGIHLFELFVKQEKYDKLPKADHKVIEETIMSEIKDFLNAKNQQKKISKGGDSSSKRNRTWGMFVRTRG